MKAASALIEYAPQPVQAIRRLDSRPTSCAKVRLLMAMIGLSLADVCIGSGKAISKSQLHRILHGQSPTAFERRAIAIGILECLKERMDSAYLFGTEQST